MIAAAKIHEACFHACVLCLSPAQAYSFLCLSCLCLACYLAACQDTPRGQLAMSLDMHEDQPFIGLVACLGYSCLDCLVSQTLIPTMHTCMSHYNDNCYTTKPRSQLNHRACAIRAACSCRVPAHSNKARRGTRLSACSLTLQYRRACRHASKNICSITFAACRHASHNRPSAPREPAKHLLRPQL
jgi:hypothetical protein